MDHRYYCFPDIHGRADLLQKALDFVYQENTSGGKIIFLGDYIDRGPENKRVLELVMNPKEGWNYVTLMGNHEQMFIDAIDGNMPQFYDPKVGLEYLPNAKTHTDIREGFPREIVDWMRKLKLSHIEDDNVFAHAYYDFRKKPEDQVASQVLWERMDDWESYHQNEDGLFLTHGHTPRRHGPVSAPNRINMDVGAVFYGKYVIGEYQQGKRGPVDFHEFHWHDFHY